MVARFTNLIVNRILKQKKYSHDAINIYLNRIFTYVYLINTNVYCSLQWFDSIIHLMTIPYQNSLWRHGVHTTRSHRTNYVTETGRAVRTANSGRPAALTNADAS
jgi:hypothetical protein